MVPNRITRRGPKEDNNMVHATQTSDRVGHTYAGASPLWMLSTSLATFSPVTRPECALALTQPHFNTKIIAVAMKQSCHPRQLK
jgi:hypothetical protein